MKRMTSFDRLYKQIAKSLSVRNKNSYADTIRCIRQRLAFCPLKTTIISLRGYRRRRPCRVDDSVDYNLLYLKSRNNSIVKDTKSIVLFGPLRLRVQSVSDNKEAMELTTPTIDYRTE
eukprot:sb/3476457/